MNLEDANSHEELVRLRDSFPVGSEPYHRTRDRIHDIIGNTNNIQTGDLVESIKAYELQTERNLRSNRLATYAALGIATLSLVVTAWSAIIARTQLQISMEPQIEVYIERKAINDDENFIVTVRNNGISSVENVNLKASVVYDDQSGVMSVQNELVKAAVLNEADSLERPVFIAPSEGERVLLLNLSYVRAVDNKEFAKRVAFFYDGFGLYSYDEVSSVPKFRPILEKFKMSSAELPILGEVKGQPF